MSDIVTIEQDVQLLFKQVEYLTEKNLIPKSYKTTEHAAMAIAYGKHLGLDPITSLNSIDIIENRIAIQARMIPGLLSKKGIAIEVVKDYEPIYDSKPSVIKDKDKMPVLDSEGKLTYYRDENGNIIYSKTEVDRITTLRFIRWYPNIGKTSSEISFRLSDAKKAGWMSKQNWTKLPSFMMMARCVSRGARLFGSDIIAGLYDNYEVAEFTDAKFDVDEEGVVILQNPNQ